MPDKNINIQVSIADNSQEVLAALSAGIPRALWAAGAVVEGYAKQGAPVDTGRLRNSITHAESGNTTTIGSNVEYAAAQELGTSRGIRPKHYLLNAVSNHGSEIENAIRGSFGNL